MAKGKVVTDDVDWDAVAPKYELSVVHQERYQLRCRFGAEQIYIVSEQGVRRGCALYSEAPCTSTTPCW